MISDEQKFLNILQGKIYKSGQYEWLFAQEMLHYLILPIYV